MGNTRSAIEPTNGELVFLCYDSLCFMIITHFILNVAETRIKVVHSSSILGPESYLHLPNYCFLGYQQSAGAIRVDWKRLYTYKGGIFFWGGGGGKADPLKIDASIDEDMECRSSYQIRKRSIQRLRIDKAK